jgi:predicted CoA-binding protein
MKTVVLGATPNPDRFAYRAAMSLTRHGHEVVPVGVKKGEVAGVTIHNTPPQVEDVHTVTLYLRPENQVQYYDYIFSLNPKRIIFNPGTENPELIRKAREKGIEAEIACTLVMLAADSY